MRIAVSGGAGFIGSHVVDRLVSQGHSVHVVDDLSSGSMANLAGVGNLVSFAQLDVRDRGAVLQALSRWRPETVIHLAAIASVVRSIAEPEYVHDVNMTGTFNVLEAARKAGTRRFVFASSAALYGMQPSLPSFEADPIAPASPYAAQKAAGELMARAYRQSWGIETVALRFFNVFGERQRPENAYSGVISIFLDALQKQGQATIIGDGEQTRDFIYVGDAARAVTVAAVGPDPGPGPYNIARGEAISIRRLYSILAHLLQVADLPAFAPTRPGDVRHSLASVEGMRSCLGVAPETTVNEGIGLMLGARPTAAERASA